MRSVALSQLSLAVRQRADLGGQQNQFGQNLTTYITDAEVVADINGSITELWDLLTLKYGDNYAWGTYLPTIVQGVYAYSLPFDFYKEFGVDLALDQTGQNWATVRPFSLRDRNQFSYPLQTALAYAGWQNMRYQIQGNNLVFLPNVGPLPGIVRLLYCPAAPQLVQTLPAAYQPLAALLAGQLIQATVAGVAQVFVALNAGTTGASAPTWPVPGTVTDSGGITWAYQGPLSLFATTFDGINGYEELVILTAAIKCLVKQEADVSALMQQKAEYYARIDAAAANRSAGDPMVISGGFGAVESFNGYGPYNSFGP